MTHRPTEIEVGTTIQRVWTIAQRDPDAYRHLDNLIAVYTWLLDDILASEHGRGFGHGASEVHVLATGTSDLEGRLHDPLLREQRRVKRLMMADLRHMGHRWNDHAANITRFAAEPWTG